MAIKKKKPSPKKVHRVYCTYFDDGKFYIGYSCKTDKLFEKYLFSGKSYKTIAEESGLGDKTIYLSVKKSKLIIAEALHEDYLDFLNGDFDLI